MYQPGRKYRVGSGYRYGFNGKEDDTEVYEEGNIYDYGFRVYNPRIGKFLSVDPLTNKFAGVSPYQYANNNPIVLIDVDGLEGDDPPKPGRKGKKEGEKVITEGTDRKYPNTSTGNCLECPNGDPQEGYVETKDWYWYSGNKNREAKADWYGKDEYDLITQDWENGQVLRPMTWLEKFPAYTQGAREWNGWGVDDRGYLTGKIPSPDYAIALGGVGGKTLKTAAGIRLILNGKNTTTASWTIYMGLKKVAEQGEKLFLYIGKAKNGVAARYSAEKLSELQIQAFDLLKNIPSNGTALGVEQSIMELNGWTNKVENTVRPLLSNKNAATVKEIYKSQGLEWLKTNVPQWEKLYKIQ